jgi:alpha-ketoglutarate-dependent 2,4-dichlorophenoxyacetate dioxygenase
MNSTQLHPLFGAELTGLDLRRPLSSDDAEALRTTLHRYGIVLVRETGLDDDSHVAFSRALGELDHRTGFNTNRSRFAHPELFDAGNLDEDGNILPNDHMRRMYNLGNELWHTDSSFRARRAAYSALRAHEVPSAGGETEFADMRVAYEALDDAMRARIDGLVVEHSLWHSRQAAGYPEPTDEERRRMPPVRHALVHTHASGRRSLYLAAHASHIVGWPVADGRALLRDLTEHATVPERVYRHAWRTNDVVIWDNLCTMHRATPFASTTERRDMRRTTVHEPLFSLAQGAAAQGEIA